MDITTKLKGFPTVYYFNLDNRTDRKKWMEKQFEKYNIYHERVSATKYLASKNSEWKNLIIDIDNYKLLVPIAANAITHLDFLKRWYYETDDEYVMLMEDDYDMRLIDHWHFTWEDLLDRLPYDWDCILLGFENPMGIRFHLHPIEDAHDFGPVLLNRNYVEKLIELHCVGNKYRLINNISSYAWGRGTEVSGSGTVDYFIAQSGKTYCLPLITINPSFGSFENSSYLQKLFRTEGDTNARNTYYFWWRHERNKYSLDEFFTYGTKNHDKMILYPDRFRKYDITDSAFKLYGEAYLDYYRT